MLLFNKRLYECFVVVLGFVAPDKIDSKFFDPKHAFKEVEVQAKTVKDLVPDKKPKVWSFIQLQLKLHKTF